MQEGMMLQIGLAESYLAKQAEYRTYDLIQIEIIQCFPSVV